MLTQIWLYWTFLNKSAALNTLLHILLCWTKASVWRQRLSSGLLWWRVACGVSVRWGWISMCRCVHQSLPQIWADKVALKSTWYTKVCVCVFTRMCVIWCMCVMLLMSLCLSVTTPHSRLEQDMDHRRSLLRCCCSPSDSSVQLDRRSCSHSAPRLASEGDKYDNYPKYQAPLFVPY